MPETRDPDSLLMERVRAGDMEAFAALVEKYQQPVMNLITRIIRDPTEAEDLAQVVFLQVYKAADRYELTARFSTWLFTIARNLCLNELRRRSRHPADSLDGLSDPEDEVPQRQFEDVKSESPPTMLLRGELESKVAEAVADLPEKQQTALLLYQQQNLAYEEIAKVIGCSLSATKSLIHRARETLKARLKPYLQTGAWEEH